MKTKILIALTVLLPLMGCGHGLTVHKQQQANPVYSPPSASRQDAPVEGAVKQVEQQPQPEQNNGVAAFLEPQVEIRDQECKGCSYDGVEEVKPDVHQNEVYSTEAN